MRRHEKPWPALAVPSKAPIVSLPVNRFSNKLASKVSNNILRSPSFCSFASLSYSFSYAFFNRSDSSSDLNVFKISVIPWLEIINVLHFANSTFLT